MKIILALVVSSLIYCSSFSQDLPHYMTDKEKEVYKNYQPPFLNTDDVTPPPTSVRTMAEWEEIQGIIITWTSYTSILRQIVDYVQDEAFVFIVCSDSNTVRSYLTSGGVPLTNLKFVLTSFNSVWCRDFGPWAAYSGISDSLKMIDWLYNRPRPLDDQVPVGFANFIGVPIYQAISSPNDLTHTGGNFMVDGNGTGFSSKLVLDENPSKTESQIDNIFHSYLGLNRYIKMETLPSDQIHHIDMHMKLLDEETLLVGQYPAGTADGPKIEANLQYVLNNFQTCYGRSYKVIRIPMPPDSSGQYPPTSNYFTYTNSVFVNKTVIVPIYGLSQDTTALRIYRENLPGYRILGINCASMIPALGAIHCITKEIGVNEPVFISHAKILTLNTNSPYEVKSYIKTKSGISSAKVFWRTDTTQPYNSVNMTQLLDTFRANIPQQSLGTKIYYYISATSNTGRTVTKPITAPSGYIKFEVDNPTAILFLNNPINYSINNTLNVNFIWNKITTALWYVLTVATDSDFNNIIVNDTISNDTSKTIFGFQRNTTYFWKMNTRDTSGIAFYSPIWNFTTIPPLYLNVKSLFEGMYSPAFNLLIRKDSLTTYLRLSTPPFNIIDSAKSIIDTVTFTGLFKFYNATTGTYYISVKHLNSIETWSKDGGEYLASDNTIFNYDFTTANSQAYGNNLKLKGSKYCLYSGDLNNDGYIDLFDVVPIYNDASNFVMGKYLPADLTGDNIVDLTDVTLCYNNSANFIRVRNP